jgi:hypothetical protein
MLHLSFYVRRLSALHFVRFIHIMTSADLIDFLDGIFTSGASVSEWKPKVISIRDQAAAFDRAFSELKARNESLVISLETAELRNSALLATHLELQQEHAKFKEAQANNDKQRWNDFADKSDPPDTFTDDGF